MDSFRIMKHFLTDFWEVQELLQNLRTLQPPCGSIFEKVPFPCSAQHDPVVWSLRQVSWFPLPMNTYNCVFFPMRLLAYHHSRILHSRKGVKHFFLELLLTKPAFQVVVQENGAHNIVHSAAIFGGHFNYGSVDRTYLPWVRSMQSQVTWYDYHNKFVISDHMLYCLHYCYDWFFISLVVSFHASSHSNPLCEQLVQFGQLCSRMAFKGRSDHNVDLCMLCNSNSVSDFQIFFVWNFCLTDYRLIYTQVQEMLKSVGVMQAKWLFEVI